MVDCKIHEVKLQKKITFTCPCYYSKPSIYVWSRQGPYDFDNNQDCQILHNMQTQQVKYIRVWNITSLMGIFIPKQQYDGTTVKTVGSLIVDFCQSNKRGVRWSTVPIKKVFLSKTRMLFINFFLSFIQKTRIVLACNHFTFVLQTVLPTSHSCLGLVLTDEMCSI